MAAAWHHTAQTTGLALECFMTNSLSRSGVIDRVLATSLLGLLALIGGFPTQAARTHELGYESWGLWIRAFAKHLERPPLGGAGNPVAVDLVERTVGKRPVRDPLREHVVLGDAGMAVSVALWCPVVRAAAFDRPPRATGLLEMVTRGGPERLEEQYATYSPYAREIPFGILRMNITVIGIDRARQRSDDIGGYCCMFQNVSTLKGVCGCIVAMVG